MTATLSTEAPRERESVPQLWARYAGFELTTTQQHFLDRVLELVSTHQHGVLEGPAGTGKSATTVAMILAASMRGYRVGVAAPTHKAANVLDKILAPWRQRLGLDLPIPQTLHSTLHLKPQRTLPGQPESFYQSREPHWDFDLLIVDECSMVGKELHRFVMEAVEAHGIALLYVGDPAQLQPVNEGRVSPSFGMPFKMRLTEVVRHDGAVLNLATRVRKLSHPQVTPASGGGTRVVTYPDQAALGNTWLQQVKEAPEDDFPVMLCWTNKARRAFNKAAREAIYGPEVPAFQDGDRVVTLAPVEKEGRMIIANNTELTINSAIFVPDYKPVDALDYSYAVWKLITTAGDPIYVLADDEVDRYKKDVAALGKEISKALDVAKQSLQSASSATKRAAQYHYGDTKERWSTEYFPLKNAFANVDFGYAITIHKSQGSTYSDVFIWPDYQKSNRERKQLLYVAVTRASREVHHLHVGLGGGSAA